MVTSLQILQIVLSIILLCVLIYYHSHGVKNQQLMLTELQQLNKGTNTGS